MTIGAILEFAGCDDIQELIDMANVGNSLMASIAVHTGQDGPLKGWAPAEDPAEVVTDLVAVIEELQAEFAEASKAAVRLALMRADAPALDDLLGMMPEVAVAQTAAEHAAMAIWRGRAFPARFDEQLYDVLDQSPDIPAEALLRFMHAGDGAAFPVQSAAALKATYVGLQPWVKAEAARLAAEAEAGKERTRRGDGHEKSGREERSAGGKAVDEKERARLLANRQPAVPVMGGEAWDLDAAPIDATEDDN